MNRHEIVLLQGAQGDLLSIYASLGERIYLRVDQALGILRVFPEAGPLLWRGHIRRLVVPRTNLGVFYTISGSRVMIGAVLDLRQSTEAISRRLQQL